MILSWVVFPVDDEADWDIFPADSVVSIKCKVEAGSTPVMGHSDDSTPYGGL